jgi:glycosyltransferase involved in cell wall biosynthesis/Flp pilus assembly protein TadD
MLVSVIVRSMGRPHLERALASLARQDYPSLEVLVVDATGGKHPPLPDIRWPSGHIVRLVCTGQPLLRAPASNAGLQAVTGTYFTFLDDDDTHEPYYVSQMVAQAAQHPDALLIYGSSNLLDSDGRLTGRFGVDFNRALMFIGPLFYLHAALIQRRVIELGCRFDESFALSEDRDFVAQIAAISDLVRVPVTAANYYTEAGTSGTGTNRNLGSFLPVERQLRAKWAGEGVHHWHRATQQSRRAVQTYFSGDVARAQSIFADVLIDYPEDPNALHGLARIALDSGDAARALGSAARSVDIAPAVAEYRLTLAQVHHALGDDHRARDHALVAAEDAAFHDAATKLLQSLLLPQHLAELSATSATMLSASAAPSTTATPSRLAPCPCGSGKRYKDCHGQLGGIPEAPSPIDTTIASAQRHFDMGQGDLAHDLLRPLATDDVDNEKVAALAGRMLTELGDYAAATRFLTRALDLSGGKSVEIAAALERSADLQHAAAFASSSYRTVARLLDRIEARARAMNKEAGADDPIHILATLGTVGGSERHALNLQRILSRYAPTQLWSTTPPSPVLCEGRAVNVLDAANGNFPVTGTLVIIGQYYEPGEWLARTNFHRIVLRNNVEMPKELVERMTEIDDCGIGAEMAFTYPSAAFQRRVGLPGLVEYPTPDLDVFVPASRLTRDVTQSAQSMVIGRHSRDVWYKHHPNDTEFYRKVTASGHRVRLLGGSRIAQALAASQLDNAIEALAPGAEAAQSFLASLDCFVYRVHPQWYETGGNVVLEAMAMALPVIVFADQVGAAELIDHEVNGFRVETEDEALAIIARLAANADLRNQIGVRARIAVEKMVVEQTERLLAFYLPRPPVTNLPAEFPSESLPLPVA